MNSLINYVKTLLPTFTRRRIMDDIAFIRKQLIDGTLGGFKAARDFFAKAEFKATETAKYNQEFMRITGIKANYIVAIAEVLERMEKNLDSTERLVEKHFSSDVSRDGMTFLRANLLRYVELMDFVIRYSRRLLIWTYIAETAALDKTSQQSLTIADVKFLQDQRLVFFNAIKVMSVDNAKFNQAIQSIPDITVNPDNADATVMTVGANRIDPLRMGLIPISMSLNPFYHISMAIAEWQANRYKSLETEIKVIEHRLLHLRNTVEGKPEPTVLKAIDNYENSLQLLNAKLRKLEDEYA